MEQTILIVDDQAFIRHVFSVALKDRFKIIQASSGVEALGILSKSPVDLVLLDVMLPGMDGFEICQRIRSNPFSKKTPVIFLTANGDKATLMKAVQVGANDFFVKNANVEALLLKIDKVLGKKDPVQK